MNKDTFNKVKLIFQKSSLWLKNYHEHQLESDTEFQSIYAHIKSTFELAKLVLLQDRKIQEEQHQAFVNELIITGNLSDKSTKGDDFFNEKGEYLYTNPTNSNNIYIIEQQIWEAIKKAYPNETQNGLLLPKLAELATLLSKFQFKTDYDGGRISDEKNLYSPDRQALHNIGAYYMKQMGHSTRIESSSSDNGVSDSTLYAQTSEDEIIIPIVGGKTNPTLDDKFNLQTALEHEEEHIKKHDGKDVSFGKGSIAHLEAYWKEITCDTWSATTPKYKETTIQTIGLYILYIPQAFLKNKKELLAKFEKQLGIKYDFSNWKELRHDRPDLIKYSPKQ